jgi:hypothetical protein
MFVLKSLMSSSLTHQFHFFTPILSFVWQLPPLAFRMFVICKMKLQTRGHVFCLLWCFGITLVNATTNITNFDLFKNTGLYPCYAFELAVPVNNTGYPSSTTVLPYPTTASWDPIQTFQVKSDGDLCSQFTTIPAIIPTTVNTPAYLPTWPSMLISWVSLSISFITLAESDDPGAPISKFFFPHLIFDFARLVAWWMNLIKGARNLRQAEWVSMVLWTVPANYAAAFSAMGRNKQIKWAGIASSVVGLYTVIHIGFSMGVVIVRWKYRDTSAGSYSPILDALTPAYLNISSSCPPLSSLPNNLFSDPDVPGWRDLQTFQFVICLVFSLPGIFSQGSEPVSPVLIKIATIVGISASLVIPSLYQALAAVLKGYPGTYTESGTCGPLVVLMMYGRLGYWDVREGIAWRVVQSVLAV